MTDPADASPVLTRFAPSPTGLLHLGHAYSALFAAALARQAGGRFIVRIEDIDRGRCRIEFEDAIFEDLDWLGLEWETPVRRQSNHMEDYARALGRLDALLYPCFCTRKEITAEIARAAHAPHGPDGPVYPGTCRDMDIGERQRLMAAGHAFALRLDLGAAMAAVPGLTWRDRERGVMEADPRPFGDIVLARKDTPTSYHLAVTVDDHAQGVSLVTRGRDLFDASHIHRVLQGLLGLDTPEYHHHRLLRDPAGRRLAKRDQALTIRALRRSGKTPAQVRALAGYP
jgi:glutamyl-Q tRNA(Asp) synthetase